ncbi:hypothetical protein B2K_39115 [Paenibacillus mucilaginosus K02]|uniref:Uncharacterized protein n=1 Tax=Paenibacillus mucilaginosus K02 TaxID=997761 RepID=I0BG09_9BACL|nr:hypothetical protein B2K_39115 [Paenibacillus mucilaginosus K02]
MQIMDIILIVTITISDGQGDLINYVERVL